MHCLLLLIFYKVLGFNHLSVSLVMMYFAINNLDIANLGIHEVDYYSIVSEIYFKLISVKIKWVILKHVWKFFILMIRMLNKSSNYYWEKQKNKRICTKSLSFSEW